MDESNAQRWLGQCLFTKTGESHKRVPDFTNFSAQVRILTSRANPYSVEWHTFMALAHDKAEHSDNVVVDRRLCDHDEVGMVAMEFVKMWMQRGFAQDQVLYVVIPHNQLARSWAEWCKKYQEAFLDQRQPFTYEQFFARQMGPEILFHTKYTVYTTGYRYKLRLLLKTLYCLYKFFFEAMERSYAPRGPGFSRMVQSFQELAIAVD